MTEAPRRLRFMIVGVARSGTTLVQRLASELEGVWVPPESHFWRHAEELARRVDWPLAPDAIDEVLDSFADFPGLSEFGFSHDIARAHLPDAPWLWHLFAAVTVAAAPNSAHVIGEKTPAHHRWAHRLLAEVESLRVIGVRRDPYETFSSHLQVPWGLRDPVEFAVRWRMADDELRLLERSFPDRVLVLDHHAVASAADDARSRIAALIGVEPHKRQSAVDDVGPLFDPSETWKTNATAAIEPSSRSRDDLSADQAEVIRAVIEDVVPRALAAEVATAVAAERRLAAISTQPLPLAEGSAREWRTSDVARSRAWEIKAIDLRAELEAARDQIEDWQTRAEKLRDAKDRWETRAVELNEEQKRTAAQLAAEHSSVESLRRQVDSLQRRRSLRAANAVGRLFHRRQRH